VKRLGGTPRLAEMLVRSGLWDRVADGYRVHDFLDFNDSAATVRKRRSEMRELGKRGGVASGQARRLNSVPLPSVPIPIPSDASTRNVDKSKKAGA